MTKSIYYRTWKILATLRPDTIVTNTYMKTQFPEGEEADAANTAMSEMTRQGVLTKVKRATFKVNVGLKEWGENRIWKQRRTVKVIKKSAVNLGKKTDTEILTEMVTAIQKAMPVIARLTELETKLKDLVKTL